MEIDFKEMSTALSAWCSGHRRRLRNIIPGFESRQVFREIAAFLLFTIDFTSSQFCVLKTSRPKNVVNIY
jgi:hypothetical protein